MEENSRGVEAHEGCYSHMVHPIQIKKLPDNLLLSSLLYLPYLLIHAVVDILLITGSLQTIVGNETDV